MSELIKFSLLGAAGRMGQEILRLAAKDKKLKLVGALESAKHSALGKKVSAIVPEIKSEIEFSNDLKKVISSETAVVVDFSTASNLEEIVNCCREQRCALIVGRTGLTLPERELLKEAAEEIAVLEAANMSRGINLLLKILPQLAEALPDYQQEIFEIHHLHKLDAPSGTALRLAEALGDKERVKINAARGGDVFGEHTVYFLGEGERIEVTHRASSRKVFAKGAIEALHFIAGKSAGCYNLQQIYGLE